MDEPDFASPFEEMAERIRKNAAAEFGGALLIVPPSGDPIAILSVTPNGKTEEPYFWGQCKTMIAVKAEERTQALQNPDPWTGRR